MAAQLEHVEYNCIESLSPIQILLTSELQRLTLFGMYITLCSLVSWSSASCKFCVLIMWTWLGTRLLVSCSYVLLELIVSCSCKYMRRSKDCKK